MKNAVLYMVCMTQSFFAHLKLKMTFVQPFLKKKDEKNLSFLDKYFLLFKNLKTHKANKLVK